MARSYIYIYIYIRYYYYYYIYIYILLFQVQISFAFKLTIKPKYNDHVYSSRETIVSYILCAGTKAKLKTI